MSNFYCLGIGLGTTNSQGDVLEVFYPQPILNPAADLISTIEAVTGSLAVQATVSLNNAHITQLAEALIGTPLHWIAQLQNSQRQPLLCLLAEDLPPTNVAEAFLKLHLLSHRLVRPHGTNLTGIFGVLKNLAWTNEGAIELSELPQRQLQARLGGRTLEVNCVDKFPKMTDYVVPTGVRIADTARVRLGAYIGEGTTVMHEGFFNFNAGTEGPNMIEGRVSAGVFVQAGSDLGGGCSTMGTLSGGGNIVISVGRECLIGANAGLGIPLGDRCTIESGLYITAGTKVALLDDHGQNTGTIKAQQLAGRSDLLFRRNSLNGGVECLTNKTAIELNAELHKHN